MNDLKRTLMDIRKMRRDVRMRRETDPEKVADTLETILKEAIVLSTTDDGTMNKAAIKELKQIRRGLLAGQIDAGSKTAGFVGSFSGVLDQIDDVEKEVTSKYNEDKPKRSFADNLPSSETVISAIMTANPIMGYTLKMGRDVVASMKKSASNRKLIEKEEAQLRRERLIEQGDAISEQIETDRLQRESIEDQSSDSEADPNTQVQIDLLKGIKDEIELLTYIIEENGTKLEKETSESTERLELIHQATDDQNRLVNENNTNNGLIRAEQDLESRASGDPLGGSSDNDSDSGGLTGLLEGFFGKIKSFFAILSKGVVLLAPLIAKGAVVLGFLKLVGDFFDGFANASELTGIQDLDWMGKVKAGISHVLSGLLEPINWISEKFFGTDLMGGESREEWTKNYFDFFDNFVDNMIGMASWIGNSILDTFSGWAESSSNFISELASDAFSPLLELMQKVKNYITESIKNLVPDFARGMFGMEEVEGATNPLTDNAIVDGAKNIYSEAGEVVEKISQMPGQLKKWIGWGDDAEKPDVESNRNPNQLGETEDEIKSRSERVSLNPDLRKSNTRLERINNQSRSPIQGQHNIEESPVQGQRNTEESPIKELQPIIEKVEKSNSKVEADYETKAKVKIEQEQVRTINSQATSAGETWDAEMTRAKAMAAQNNNPIIMAPATNQTNVNNAQYTGAGSSENREPTHRRFSNNNYILGSGNL